MKMDKGQKVVKFLNIVVPMLQNGFFLLSPSEGQSKLEWLCWKYLKASLISEKRYQDNKRNETQHKRLICDAEHK
jgi:hypothetical protein